MQPCTILLPSRKTLPIQGFGQAISVRSLPFTALTLSLVIRI